MQAIFSFLLPFLPGFSGRGKWVSVKVKCAYNVVKNFLWQRSTFTSCCSTEQDSLKLRLSLAVVLLGAGNIILFLIRNVLQTNSDTCKFNTYGCTVSAEGEQLLFSSLKINHLFWLCLFISDCSENQKAAGIFFSDLWMTNISRWKNGNM